MEDAIGDRNLNRLPQQRLNLIDGCISSYCSILNSPERLDLIKKANKLVSVLSDIESDRLWGDSDINKILVEAEDYSNKKSEQKYMSEYYWRLKSLNIC